MRKCYFIISLLFISSTLIAQTYVPDDNFEQALINKGLDDVLDNYVLTNNIVGISDLDVSDSRFIPNEFDFGIRDLTGIEDFVSLKSLDCSNNNIISLDLSSNTALTNLFCPFNDLICLNVNSNTELTSLIAGDNELTQLNVSFNTKLEFLFCFNNRLTSLDTRNNINLVRLRCYTNNLRYLNIKNGNNTNIHDDVVLGFDASDNPDLTCIQVDDAAYSNANWSFKDSTATYGETCYNSLYTYVPDDNFEQALINQGLDGVLDNYVLTSNISGITNLDVNNSRYGTDDFGIRDLTGIEDFVSLQTLDCSYNNIINLDLSSNTALTELFCNVNDLMCLNVTSNTGLKILNCNSNNLKHLNVRFNLALEILYCVENNLKSLDVSFNTVLERLRCAANDLTYLNVKNGNNVNFAGDVVLGFEATGNPNLTCIQVDDASYSNANWTFKDATATYSETCYTVPIFVYIPDDFFEKYFIDLGLDDVLDDYILLNKLVAIKKLDVSNKGISDLTGIEAFTALESLYCNHNNLTNLDLSSNTALALLDCSNNNLESLNLKNGNNIHFIGLNTTGNPDLACIQVDDIDFCNINWKDYKFRLNYFYIDKGTKFSTDCGILNVNDISESSYEIYPNPVSDLLTVKSSDPIDNITIMDLQGAKVLSTPKSTIDFSSLQAGMYLLKLEHPNRISFKRVVKK